MTDIIRLNDSINDYAARPVITRLGEPDLVIRPSTYLDALGSSANIDPEQILIDGSFGQTSNLAPWLGVGTGTMTIKSDADGVYLAMSQKGIRTGIVMNTRNDTGTLTIIKYRLNDILETSTRLLSLGAGSSNTANFGLVTLLEPKRVRNSNGAYSAELDNLVHTIAIYSKPDERYLIEGGKKYADGSSPGQPNGLTGVGINTRSNDDTQPNDLDLYNFEMYLDVSLTEQQITDYLKTL